MQCSIISSGDLPEFHSCKYSVFLISSTILQLTENLLGYYTIYQWVPEAKSSILMIFLDMMYVLSKADNANFY